MYKLILSMERLFDCKQIDGKILMYRREGSRFHFTVFYSLVMNLRICTNVTNIETTSMYVSCMKYLRPNYCHCLHYSNLLPLPQNDFESYNDNTYSFPMARRKLFKNATSTSLHL